MHERITARRAELDELEEKPAKQLSEVRAERDEPAVAVRLVPDRASGVAESTLPADYQGWAFPPGETATGRAGYRCLTGRPPRYPDGAGAGLLYA